MVLKIRNTFNNTQLFKSTVKRLGLTEEVKFSAPKYVMVNGVPHQMKNGNLVPMKSK